MQEQKGEVNIGGLLLFSLIIALCALLLRTYPLIKDGVSAFIQKRYIEPLSQKKDRQNEPENYQLATGNTARHIQGDKGDYGEYLIFKSLEQLHTKGYMLGNLYIPYKNGTTEIDVVLIHATGIYVFESKNLTGNVYGNVDASQWVQHLGRRKYNVYNPVWQNNTHLNALSNVLGISKQKLHSYIVFGENTTLKKLTLKKSPPPVLTIDHLHKILKKDMLFRKRVFSGKDMRLINGYLWQYSRVDEDVKSRHIESVQRKRKAG